jgi:hypothetical protein
MAAPLPALAAMASIGMPLVVDWPHINRRWRDIDRRRWRVIDGRRRSDIHRLRCECVAHNGSDTKSEEPRTNGRTIACMRGSRERQRGNTQYHRRNGYSHDTVHF